MNKCKIGARLISKEEMRLNSKKKPLKVVIKNVVDKVVWKAYKLTKL